MFVLTFLRLQIYKAIVADLWQSANYVWFLSFISFLIAALIFSAGYYSTPIFFTSSNFFEIFLTSLG